MTPTSTTPLVSRTDLSAGLGPLDSAGWNRADASGASPSRLLLDLAERRAGGAAAAWSGVGELSPAPAAPALEGAEAVRHYIDRFVNALADPA